MKTILKKLFNAESLSEKQAHEAMDLMMSGEADPELIAAFLGALAAKGIVKEELTGFVKSLRSHANTINITHEKLIDTAGTGGDGANTFNISTTACFYSSSSRPWSLQAW